ncbi:MAG: DNA/RNA non-specific endonuclease [Sphingomonas sp.]|nr:DNA/RNA non-specific endonuclease [Sphingomonas sp.]
MTRNGYAFELDAHAQTRKAYGFLGTASKPPRSRTAQARAGGPDRRPTDEGGHYIAARFNGPTDAFNHFAQDRNFNRRGYRRLEEQLERLRKKQKEKNGRGVFFKVIPFFDGKSQRPSELNIWFTVDGKTESVNFPNESEKKRDRK